MTRSTPMISIVFVCVLSFAIFGCTEADEPAEEISIPDAQLRDEIRWELNLPHDTPITVVTMHALTELNAKFISLGFIEFFVVITGGEFAKPISDLTGLDYAENLVALNLGENNIVNVSPLAGLKNLETLNLNNNEIADVNPLTELKNLKVLGLGNNHLIDVSPLAGLKNLETLNLNNNEIAAINPLEGLENLQVLHLTGNPLSDDSKKRIIPIIEANGTEVSY